MIKMEHILKVTIIGLITGIFGTSGGALLVLMLKKIDDRLLTLVLGMSAGIMTVVVFLDLIPEALVVGSMFTTITGMLLGVGLIGLMDISFPHQHFMRKTNGTYLKAGVLLAIGIALHNIPEGLAIGAGYSAASVLGFGLAIIIGIQNFPEGMAIATNLALAGLKGWQILFISILSGIPMGLGAFIGVYLGGISPMLLSMSLGFAAGAMLYITFDELIPSAHEKAKGKMAIFGILTGVFLGVILSGGH